MDSFCCSFLLLEFIKNGKHAKKEHHYLFVCTEIVLLQSVLGLILIVLVFDFVLFTVIVWEYTWRKKAALIEQ